MSQSLARRTSLPKQEKQERQEENERKQLTDRIIRVLTNTPIPVSKRGIVEGLTKGQKSKLGKLTLEDFELIRENPRVKNIMANILEIDVTRLQEIVTVAKGHKKQIESSSKNKRLAKSLSLRSLKDVVPTFLKEIPAIARPAIARPARPARPARAPLIDMINPDIMGIIMGHVKPSLEYKLRDWIPKEKLVLYALSKNYNAIDYLVKNKEKIDYEGLSANTNPKALDLLRQQIAINPDSIDWDALSKNPIAMPLLLENKKRIVWKAFCSNPHPYTITLLKNTMMEDYDNRHNYLDWKSLSSNTSNEAIAFLFLPENIHNIDWKVLSDNTNPEAIKLLAEKAKEGRDELNWFAICRNENAIDIILDALKNYAWYIKWSTLVNNTNPKVINIIKNILNLSDDDITKQQIRWFELSPNPSAIYILLENQDKIMWTTFCGNTMIKHPKALKLLEEKIEEENKQRRKEGNNITWSVLSANPSIFVLS